MGQSLQTRRSYVLGSCHFARGGRLDLHATAVLRQSAFTLRRHASTLDLCV